MESLEHIKTIVKQFKVKPRPQMRSRVLDEALKIQRSRNLQSASGTYIWRMLLWSKAGYLAASFLVIASFVISFVLYGKVVNLRNKLELAQQDIAITPVNDSVTINFYLKEHQDLIARQASQNMVTPQSLEVQVRQQDIVFYEIFDDRPEFMRPGIIVRGPSYQRQISLTEAPAISNGHNLTLSEAREIVDFDLVSPSWLHPGYMLDQIRRIEGRHTLHLLYTDGANTISLFEQPLDGHRRLSPQDFREYAVYRNEGQTGGVILTWRDDTLSYVLIGNIEMSQLMDMAQSISSKNGRK